MSKKLIRSNSETNFFVSKKKMEILNNNLKTLKDPINNKEYQVKRKISKRITQNVNVNTNTCLSKSII